MSVTHVATATDSAMSTPETPYLPASSVSILTVPPAVADGDIVIVAGTSQYATMQADPGWNQLVEPRMAMYYGPTYKPGTPSGGQRSIARGYTGLWWRRWGPGIDTVAISGAYLPGWPPSVLTIWRGAQGFRGLAVLARDTLGSLQWPGVAGGATDAAVLLGEWRANVSGQALSSTSPATTVRASSSRGDNAVVALSDGASAGTTPGYVADVPGSTARLLAVTLCLPIAPLAPTLGAPVPSLVADLASGPTFTWTHRPAGYQGSASGAQDAYALRRRVGVGAYEYWNAGTAAWDASIVWNSSVVGSVTFPTGAWTNETDYAWSVATREAAASVTGPFAPDRVLTARTAPVVTVTAPTGVVTTPQPPIAWTTSTTSPWVAIAYEVKLFTQAIADTVGFDPDIVAPVWTSGQYASTAGTVTPSIPLANGGSYAAYVRVQQSGGQWSAWDRSDFLVSLAAPARPAITAAPSTDPISGCPIVVVTVDARDNLLAAADASVEVTNSWTAGDNTTLSTDTVWAADGTHCLVLTATAAGDTSADLPTAVPVTVDALYTATAVFRAAATPREVSVTILWEDTGGLSLGSSPATAVLDSTSTDTTVTVTAASPTGTAGARLQVTVTGCAASEVHRADKLGLAPGADTPWSPGGFTDVTTTIEYSDDPLAGVWGTLDVLDLTGSATRTDWTPQPGQLRTYRATTNAGTYSSPASPVAVAGIDVSDYWLVDPAGTAMRLRLTTDATRTDPRDRGELTSFGRRVSQIQYGDERTTRGSYTAWCETAAQARQLVDYLNAGVTLLVQGTREPAGGPYAKHLYLAVTADPTIERVVQGPFAWRLVTWEWRADDPPAGEAFGGTYPAGYAGVF